MGGYTMTMPRREAIPHSIAAGCDMLCFGTDIREDISYILDAVADGRLSHCDSHGPEGAIALCICAKEELAIAVKGRSAA
ncbi:MAG: hypothetical protein LUE89_10540 [Clostridiales bacterium]|nr:hypothetical protein [Clostridiales bacterium]